MSLPSPFALALLTIVALSLLGLPIGLAMVGGSVLYLAMAGLDGGKRNARRVGAPRASGERFH